MLLRVGCRLCVRVGSRLGRRRGARPGPGQGIRRRQAVRLHLLRRHRRHGPHLRRRVCRRHHPAGRPRRRCASPACPPAPSRSKVRPCAPTCRACRSSHASGCRRSITGASAARSPAWALPIATSTSIIRAPSSIARRARRHARAADAAWRRCGRRSRSRLRLVCSASSLQIEPERRRLRSEHPAADRFDRGDHAAVAAEQPVGQRYDADIRRRRRRGAAQAPARCLPRRDAD